MSDQTLTTPTSATFAVSGMNCMSCVRHVEQAVREHLSSAEASVDLAANRVVVTFDPTTASVDAIVRVLGEAGYDAQPV